MRRLLLALLAACLAGGVAAQSPEMRADKASAKKPAVTKPAKKAAKAGPEWAELTAEQQRVLAPLKSDWENLTPERRRKWIGIAKRYPAMQPIEQTRIQNRMQRWANLSPEQRAQARENYKRMAKASAEKRKKLREQWLKYQASLPPEQRQHLPPGADAEPSPQ